MGRTKLNQYHYLTAKERDRLSFPARLAIERGWLKGEILDFGCGFGSDVQLLSELGLNVKGYDVHYFPEYPQKKFDTILCFYVLNVLLPEEQAKVLVEISRLLRPTGKAYFAVRRDLQFEGYRTHKLHKKKTYQCNVKLPFRSVFVNGNCEIYEYQHFNRIEKTINISCPFCNSTPEQAFIAETATAFAIFDKFPVNPGHALIIPKRHCADYFELSIKEQQACWFLLNHVKCIIASEFNPNGFNVGVNINQAGGQTIPHVHIHLIPRYAGDIENPTGGVRGVIPEKRDYTID
ncbi:HIT domain-containing protein [Mangrovibacterium marinum]|uniref:HIT domain-containing protein n=1 Tax=Mangrovibacterium marinum TaxID=1639118 RepID=UPI002A18B470|nr:HIT domain-containing protein [Mangrovibacterium marinum]